MAEFVRVERGDGGVATVRLDRAPVNALSPHVWGEIHKAAVEVAEDDAIRAVVIWGGPKVFAAGGDIKAMQGMTFRDYLVRGRATQEAVRAVAAIPQITIAAINGYALGGGCELAMAADFRVAADNASLGQPEILLGLIPGAGGTQRLSRLVGPQRAREMIYSGAFYSGQDSCEMGLVDEVVPAGEVYEHAVQMAGRYAKGPYALRLAKRAISEGIELDLDSALKLETSLFAACFATQDSAIGIQSFIEHGPGKARFEEL